MSADLDKLLAEATEGPWELDGIAIAGSDPRSGDVCYMGEPAQYPGDIARMLTNWQANARLIALSPDLARQVIALTADNAALRAKAEKLAEALQLYSCEDGCNDCPEHERDRVGCGWTARAALTEWGTP